MKKLLTLAALLGAVSLSFGQGYVGFWNTTGQRIYTNGVAVSGGLTGAVGNWYFALLVAPSTQNSVDASLTGWTFTGCYGTNTLTRGVMAGNSASDGSSGAGPLPSPYAVQSTGDYVVVAWSANLGSDWNAVFNGRPTSTVSGIGNQGLASWSSGVTGGWYGISGVADNVIALALGANYNNIFGEPTAGRIGAFALNYYIVPEPTTFALAGLGAAAMLIFRRRK